MASPLPLAPLSNCGESRTPYFGTLGHHFGATWVHWGSIVGPRGTILVAWGLPWTSNGRYYALLEPYYAAQGPHMAHMQYMLRPKTTVQPKLVVIHVAWWP